jgi:hypothetical protein
LTGKAVDHALTLMLKMEHIPMTGNFITEHFVMPCPQSGTEIGNRPLWV